ncbi:MAG: IS66 family transposase, partial [Alphaproteobacteria bacterium]|nr:IS66 family transposase [Alphaproteobacteria bacterium]
MLSDDLPTDIDALRGIVLRQAGELAAAKAGLVHKALEVEKLKIELARLRRMQFGRSSEK